MIGQAVKLAAAQPPVILRSTLADPPVLTTPQPLVTWTPVRWPPTFPVILTAFRPGLTGPQPALLAGVTAGSPHGRWQSGPVHDRYAAGDPHGHGWQAAPPHDRYAAGSAHGTLGTIRGGYQPVYPPVYPPPAP